MNDIAHAVLVAALATALGFAAGVVASQRQSFGLEVAYAKCSAQTELWQNWLQAAHPACGGVGPVGRK